VLDNLAALEPRPTLLLVTHDPLVARRADRLVEVRGGRVSDPVGHRAGDER
jgi:predicted ABC-type transport system involved in lysophospholipase L1 biosynthesis ATPase subunit